ncbi:hypothetical protein B566_EDAN014831, partial [Ephemera danica]
MFSFDCTYLVLLGVLRKLLMTRIEEISIMMHVTVNLVLSNLQKRAVELIHHINGKQQSFNSFSFNWPHSIKKSPGSR